MVVARPGQAGSVEVRNHRARQTGREIDFVARRKWRDYRVSASALVLMGERLLFVITAHLIIMGKCNSLFVGQGYLCKLCNVEETYVVGE